MAGNQRYGGKTKEMAGNRSGISRKVSMVRFYVKGVKVYRTAIVGMVERPKTIRRELQNPPSFTMAAAKAPI